MDTAALAKVIIREAQKNIFNGVGRVHTDHLKKAYGTTDQQIQEALQQLPFRHRFWPPDETTTILIYFKERG
jgi:hypothetical protein